MRTQLQCFHVLGRATSFLLCLRIKITRAENKNFFSKKNIENLFDFGEILKTSRQCEDLIGERF